MSDWNLPSPQYNPNSKPEYIEKIDIDKLSLDPDYPQEEPLQVADSLIPPATTEEVEKTTAQEKTDVWTYNYQQEGKDYKEQQKKYVRHLSDEKSDTQSDFSSFSYYT